LYRVGSKYRPLKNMKDDMRRTAFDPIPMGREGLQETYRWLEDFVGENPSMAEKKIIGTSPEGLDIPAILITDQKGMDEDKQIAVVTLGRHGQELGTRVVGPEILNYLVSGDAEEVRNRQMVIVVPVVNPDGFVRNEFHSSLFRLTKTERIVLGGLFHAFPPEMVIDYHSLGKDSGSKHDRGDMEVIIPANTSRWGMDEQVHQHVAHRMRRYAEDAGWPYEIHSLEDLALYYFGGTAIGEAPWTCLQEKFFQLHMQNSHDGYDVPKEASYTNYTCGAAYIKWHSIVFGIEANHYAISKPGDIAASGMAPCKALLEMGCTRFPWEKDKGYPVNILHGDFRVSIRAVGRSASERRASRIRLWKERAHFSLPQREMPDPETTLARVRYFGTDLPMQFALCLRMRQRPIRGVTLGGREVEFETFIDHCSTYAFIPLAMEKSGTLEVSVKHAPS
jgi:hypothetical protein